MAYVHKINEKVVFSNSSGLKSVSEKLRPRDATVKLRFQISPGSVDGKAHTVS